jgi:hypothetical protein
MPSCLSTSTKGYPRSPSAPSAPSTAPPAECPAQLLAITASHGRRAKPTCHMSPLPPHGQPLQSLPAMLPKHPRAPCRPHGPSKAHNSSSSRMTSCPGSSHGRQGLCYPSSCCNHSRQGVRHPRKTQSQKPCHPCCPTGRFGLCSANVTGTMDRTAHAAQTTPTASTGPDTPATLQPKNAHEDYNDLLKHYIQNLRRH